MANQKILILTDNRTGHTHQTLGVAEALSMPYTNQQISYTLWAKLPQWLPVPLRWRVSKASWRALCAKEDVEVCIAAGRRLAQISWFLKRKKRAAKIVQIMDPKSSRADFDLIAVPQHDKVPAANNILPFLLPPHNLKEETLAQVAKEWKSKLPRGDRGMVGVLIGGNYKGHRMGYVDCHRFAEQVNTIVDQHARKVALVTSRRTPTGPGRKLLDWIRYVQFFHFWHLQQDRENPYMGILACCDVLAVTGDSVSMVAEAVATGKPVFILDSPGFIEGKHRRFVDELYRQKIVFRAGDKLPGKKTGARKIPSKGATNKEGINSAEEIASRIKKDLIS